MEILQEFIIKLQVQVNQMEPQEANSLPHTSYVQQYETYNSGIYILQNNNSGEKPKQPHQANQCSNDNIQSESEYSSSDTEYSPIDRYSDNDDNEEDNNKPTIQKVDEEVIEGKLQNSKVKVQQQKPKELMEEQTPIFLAKEEKGAESHQQFCRTQEGQNKDKQKADHQQINELFQEKKNQKQPQTVMKKEQEATFRQHKCQTLEVKKEDEKKADTYENQPPSNEFTQQKRNSPILTTVLNADNSTSSQHISSGNASLSAKQALPIFNSSPEKLNENVQEPQNKTISLLQHLSIFTQLHNKIRQLSQKLQNTEKDLDDSKLQLSIFVQEVSKSDILKKEFKTKIDSLQVKNKDKKRRIHELQANLKSQKEIQEGYQGQIQTLINESQSNKKILKQNQKELELKNQQIERLKKQAAKLFEDKFSTNNQLLKQNEQLSFQNDRKIKNLVQKYQRQQQQYLSEIKKSSQMNRDLLRKSNLQNTELQKLKKEISSHSQKNKELQLKLIEVQNEKRMEINRISASIEQESKKLVIDELAKLYAHSNKIAETMNIQTYFDEFKAKMQSLSSKYKEMQANSASQSKRVQQHITQWKSECLSNKNKEIEDKLKDINNIRQQLNIQHKQVKKLQAQKLNLHQNSAFVASQLIKGFNQVEKSYQQRERQTLNKFKTYIEQTDHKNNQTLKSIMNELQKTLMNHTQTNKQIEDMKMIIMERQGQVYLLEKQLGFSKIQISRLLETQKQLKGQIDKLTETLKERSQSSQLRQSKAVDKAIKDLDKFYTGIINDKEQIYQQVLAINAKKQEDLRNRFILKEQIYSTQICSLQRKIEQLEASQIRKATVFQQSLTELEDKLSDLNLQLQDSQSSYNKLSQEKGQLEVKLSQVKLKQEKESQTIKNLVEQIEKMTTDQLQDYMISVQDDSEILIETVKLFYYRERQIQRTHEQILQAKQQEKALQIETCLIERQSDKEQIQLLKQKVSKYQTMASQKCKQQVNEKKDKLVENDNDLFKLKRENANYIATLECTEKKCSDLQAKLSEKEWSESQMKRRIQTLEREKKSIESQQKRGSQRNYELETLKKSYQKLQEEIKEKTSSNDSLKRQKIAIQAKVAGLQRQIETKSQQQTKLTYEISQLQTKVQKQQTELNSRKRQTLQDSRSKEETVSRSIYSALQKKYNQLTKEHGILRTNISTLVQQKKALEKQIQDVNQKNKRVQNKTDINQVRQMQDKIKAAVELKYLAESKKQKQSLEAALKQNRELKAAKSAVIPSQDCPTCEFNQKQIQQLLEDIKKDEKQIKQKDDQLKKLREELKYMNRSSIRNASSPPKEAVKVTNNNKSANLLTKNKILFTSSACMTDEITQYKQYLRNKILQVSEYKTFETKLLYRLGQSNQPFPTYVTKDELAKNSLAFLFKKGKNLFAVILFQIKIKGTPFAFILSLNNQKAIFRCNFNQIVPVRFQISSELTFGNGQVKYRHGSKLVSFSDLVTRYFEKFNKNVLIDEDNKLSYEVEEMEVYRITFP